MKLLGRDIPVRELVSRIEERLRLRGLPTSEAVEVPAGGVEPRVEPLTFNLHALEEHADATRALPLHTHRGGAGQLVLVAKWAFRKSCQVFINEALGRQRVFNGHVRDSYAQLSAEVIRLRREVEQLRARQADMPPGDDRRPVAAKAPPVEKATPSEKLPPVRRNARPEKAASQGSATSSPRPTTGLEAGPLATAETVLPRPRQESAPRTRPETAGAEPSTTGSASPRPRKPGPRQRGRRR
jgi:hypothetical protein